MKNFNELLKKYAKLAVRTGVNVTENQTLVISAPISAVDFVRELTKEAYIAGAKYVQVDWNDEELSLIRYENGKDDIFDYFPRWKAETRETLAKEGAAFLSISAANPDLLKSIDPKLIARSTKAMGMAIKEYRNIVQKGNVRWSVISIPTVAWAKKVFPESTEEDAVLNLWEKIFTITRVDQEDPIVAWDKHVEILKTKSTLLNDKQYKYIHLKSEKTDLMIELPKNHIWIGGGSYDHNKNYYVANIPTEEIFTAPLKTGLNGVVYSTKPLNYSGNLIDNFSLTFENGKIVDFSAEQGYEVLKGLIETDEGSHYIGELALVPDDSPISNTDLIFYNTLFDENASCHLAIGSAYPSCVKDGTKMNQEELEKHGLNTSLTHVDFMIGSADLSVTGITESGEKHPIFTNGNWSE